MYRATKMSGVWYAVEFNNVIGEADNIEELVNGGDLTIIAETIEEIKDLVDDEVKVV